MHLIRIASIPLTARVQSAVEANLYDGDVQTETAAAHTLGGARPVRESTIRALLARMDYRSGQFATVIIEALGATHDGSELMMERLASELSNSDDYIQRAAAEALGEIGAAAKLRSEPALKASQVGPGKQRAY